MVKKIRVCDVCQTEYNPEHGIGFVTLKADSSPKLSADVPKYLIVGCYPENTSEAPPKFLEIGKDSNVQFSGDICGMQCFMKMISEKVPKILETLKERKKTEETVEYLKRADSVEEEW